MGSHHWPQADAGVGLKPHMGWGCRVRCASANPSIVKDKLQAPAQVCRTKQKLYTATVAWSRIVQNQKIWKCHLQLLSELRDVYAQCKGANTKQTTVSSNKLSISTVRPVGCTKACTVCWTHPIVKAAQILLQSQLYQQRMLHLKSKKTCSNSSPERRLQGRLSGVCPPTA